MIVIIEDAGKFKVMNMTLGSVLGVFDTEKEAEKFKYKVLN